MAAFSGNLEQQWQNGSVKNFFKSLYQGFIGRKDCWKLLIFYAIQWNSHLLLPQCYWATWPRACLSCLSVHQLSFILFWPSCLVRQKPGINRNMLLLMGWWLFLTKLWEAVQGCRPRWLPPCLCSSSPSPTLVVSFGMWILCFGGKCTVEVLHKRNKKENEKALENIVLCKMLMHKTVSIKQWIKDLKPEKSAESEKKTAEEL